MTTTIKTTFLLEQIYVIILMQHNNRFLPTARKAKVSAPSAGLASVIGCPHIKDLNVIKSLYRISNLSLVRLLVHLKGISITHIRKMHPLLSNQWSDYYTIVFHAKHLLL